jgi:hypothetical protein
MNNIYMKIAKMGKFSISNGLTFQKKKHFLPEKIQQIKIKLVLLLLMLVMLKLILMLLMFQPICEGCW